ncbi:hypothetical protein RRG08_005625 [Elysia crispata]|uniref:Uncharacterized protein n=1 Tax=Elysia crispata TaxID=231223 RepID=A0AAE1D6X7_9GAST|nr:hypothetical protein RRG08_005625 [Elysia crispata]
MECCHLLISRGESDPLRTGEHWGGQMKSDICARIQSRISDVKTEHKGLSPGEWDKTTFVTVKFPELLPLSFVFNWQENERKPLTWPLPFSSFEAVDREASLGVGLTPRGGNCSSQCRSRLPVLVKATDTLGFV